MKKFFILFLCLTLCFLSACAPENMETTSSTTTSNLSDNTPQDESNSNSSENDEVSDNYRRLEFENLEFLKEVLRAAGGTKEEYNAFLAQTPWNFRHQYESSYRIMRDFREKILVNDFPFLKAGAEIEGPAYIYFPTLNKFYVGCRINGVRYMLSYFYGASTNPSRTDFVIEDYQIGVYSIDLYQLDNYPDYFGSVILENGYLAIHISSGDNPPPDASNLFEFKPLDLSAPTE